MINFTVFIFLAVAISCLFVVYYLGIMLPRQMDSVYRESLAAFARAVEHRSNGRYGYTSRVLLMCGVVATALELKSNQKRRLSQAVYLRDVGLSAIPYDIINKAEPRDPAEKAVFDRHPDIGAGMIKLLPHLREAAPIVLYHQAYWDSPHKPRRNHIPIESRILNVVGTYCELEMKHGSAVAISAVQEARGTRFDPKVTDVFLKHFGMIKKSPSVVVETDRIAVSMETASALK